jgi:hypothetical protein
MLNYIWFGLMAIALVVAAFNGTADAVTKGAVDSAKTAVEIALGLVGIMTLWLGIMRIAEAAGLVSLLGRALRPVLRWLFPEVPADHPAAGAIVVAIAANMLGLNNAATPLGIKAMEELQELNPRQGHGHQRDGHVHGDDDLRRAAHPGDDDRRARRGRFDQNRPRSSRRRSSRRDRHGRRRRRREAAAALLSRARGDGGSR